MSLVEGPRTHLRETVAGVAVVAALLLTLGRCGGVDPVRSTPTPPLPAAGVPAMISSETATPVPFRVVPKTIATQHVPSSGRVFSAEQTVAPGTIGVTRVPIPSQQP